MVTYGQVRRFHVNIIIKSRFMDNLTMISYTSSISDKKNFMSKKKIKNFDRQFIKLCVRLD